MVIAIYPQSLPDTAVRIPTLFKSNLPGIQQGAIPDMKKKSAGILGGMGPEATIDLMSRVVRCTPAKDDIDHIRMVIDNNPQVPSRIKALYEKTGEDPVPCIQDMARRLEAFGVDFLAMPCNTAHYYFDKIQNVVGIPFLNMIEIASKKIVQDLPEAHAVGILASTVVLELGLYEKEFAKYRVRLITPPQPIQDELMRAIRLIKTGQYDEKVLETLQIAADTLVGLGAEAIIVACTELSIISSGLRSSAICYDSAQILAEAIVEKAHCET